MNPEPVVELQKKLLEHFYYTVVPQNELHLTLFYFGKLTHSYHEMTLKSPNLTVENFYKSFSYLLNKLEVPRKINIKTTNLDIFGSINNPILVLRLEKTQEILHVRTQILGHFSEFLSGLGISDVNGFMNSSENLKYQLEENYKPHISIGVFNSRAHPFPSPE